MKIQVFGTSCPSCKQLYERTKHVVKDLGLDTDVEYISDLQKLLDLGVMSSPVLVIDNKVIVAGQLPTFEKIKELIIANKAEEPKKVAGACSCCSHC